MSETNLQLFPGIFRSTVGGENPGFFLHSDGRVGIGNKAPTAIPTWDTDPNSTEKNKLNVSGHTHIEGNLNVTGSVYGDGSNMTGVTLPWAQSTPNLATDIKYEGGNVGIGGVAGTERLKVHGTVEATSFSGILATDVPTLDTSKISGLANSATITATSANTADEICQRNSSGDIKCRLFRSEYQNQSDCGAGIAFRNSTTDNYIRFCTTMSSVRSRIGSASNNVFRSNPYGIYNEIDNEWVVKGIRNSYTVLYYNGTSTFNTGIPNVFNNYGLRVYGSEAIHDYTDPQADWFQNGGSIQAEAPITTYSCYFQYSIRAWAIAVFSDMRIKCDFTEIDDTFALEKLRQLKPTSYRYIDKTRVTVGKVLGFIAQEVAEVLPDAVSKTKSVIPNIQTEASIKKIDEEKFELTLKEPHPVTVGTMLEIKSPTVGHLDVEVVSVINDTTFTIFTKDEQIDKIGDRVWVYGEYVDDFHNLDKNAIWTVATAALQEVDRQLQAEKEKVASLEERLAALEAIVLNQ